MVLIWNNPNNREDKAPIKNRKNMSNSAKTHRNKRNTKNISTPRGAEPAAGAYKRKMNVTKGTK